MRGGGIKLSQDEANGSFGAMAESSYAIGIVGKSKMAREKDDGEEDEESWRMTKEERKREVEAEPEGIPQTEKTGGAL